MTDIELNAILYYADFLSLKLCSIPVTDSCKYFFIYDCPINSAYIAGVEPEYSEENPYFIRAYTEYNTLRNLFGDEAVLSFILDIACLKACGCVDAERMLKCIHLYSEKHERKQAFKIYLNWLNNLSYLHTITDDEGNQVQQRCTKYIQHAEKMPN